MPDSSFSNAPVAYPHPLLPPIPVSHPKVCLFLQIGCLGRMGERAAKEQLGHDSA